MTRFKELRKGEFEKFLMRSLMSKINPSKNLNILNDTEKEILFSLKPFFKSKGILSGGTSLILLSNL